MAITPLAITFKTELAFYSHVGESRQEILMEWCKGIPTGVDVYGLHLIIALGSILNKLIISLLVIWMTRTYGI